MVALKRTTRGEQWKPVVGYEGIYEVSDRGRVRGIDRLDAAGRCWSGRVMRQQRDRAGYLVVCLRNGAPKLLKAHILVAKAFTGDPPGKIGLGVGDWQVNHRNAIKSDNRAQNLEWVTSRENRNHAKLLNLYANGSRIHRAVLTDQVVRQVRVLRAKHLSPRWISNILGVSRSAVRHLVYEGGWRHVR